MAGGYKKLRPEDNPKPFQKGNNANPNGAPKKIYTIIREMGYSANDLKTSFAELTWYSIKELETVKDDPDKPAIVRIVANQLLIALKSGDMNKVREILEYTLGKPKQETDVNIKETSSIPVITWSKSGRDK
jgi:hypothetical protein